LRWPPLSLRRRLFRLPRTNAAFIVVPMRVPIERPGYFYRSPPPVYVYSYPYALPLSAAAGR